MKHLYIILLFFSISCNDDDDNNDSIPVSEYPELILGHWKNEIVTRTTTTQSIEIDPIYGTETSETSSQTNNYPPFSYDIDQPIYFYYTFKFDETLDFYWIQDWFENPKFYGVFLDGSGTYSINQNQIIISLSDIFFNSLIGQIQDFTNSSFTLNKTTIDTTEIVNNLYSIIETSENYFFERIEESDIPTSN